MTEKQEDEEEIVVVMYNLLRYPARRGKTHYVALPHSCPEAVAMQNGKYARRRLNNHVR